MESTSQVESLRPLKTTTQYSLRSLLVTMLTVGMVLGYVRMFGESAVNLAFIGLAGAAVLGGVAGWFAGRLVETLIWSLLCCILLLCCVISADRLNLDQVAHWLTVGAVTGTLAGVLQPRDIRWRVTATAGVLVVLWLILGIAFRFFADLDVTWFDWLLTLPVAIALLLLVQLVNWLEHKYHTALDVWAAGLVFAVIAGNFGAILVWNLWYV
jgi:hypothetical protein